jgi:hypothetical protein
MVKKKKTKVKKKSRKLVNNARLIDQRRAAEAQQ